MPAPPSNQVRQQLLSEALQLSRCLVNARPSADADWVARRQTRLREIQSLLKGFAHPIQRDRLPVANIPIEVRKTFVKAVLMVTRYQQVGGATWRGTLHSPTLSLYHPDPIPATWLSDRAIALLCEQFDLPDPVPDELATLLQDIDRQITQQQQIIQAVLQDVGLGNGADLTTDAVLVLFQHLFGPIPIPPEALDCVYTDTQIYFCLNYHNGQLYQRQMDGSHIPIAWDQFSESDRNPIQRVLQTLGQFSFEKFRRFPIFGACDPDHIDNSWCDRLAQTLKLPTAEILRVLVRSVSIIPTQKAEAFLVHDIWGHHWQLMLTQFESDYAILANCDEPLRAAETAYTLEGPLTCRDLFAVTGGRVELDERRSRLFFHGEVQQRLGLLFTHIIGELLADVAEFKFIWDHTHASDQLLSSSLFKLEPTKLDLSLADLDFLFLQVLKPLLDIRLSVLEDSPLEIELMTRWAEIGLPVESLDLRTSLKQAIVQLYQIFLEEYSAAYLPTLEGDIGLFTQIVSNLLYLQNAISTLYTDLTATQSALPFQDLLIVFVGSFCSSDCYAEFWEIDDILAAYFLPCWHHLCDAEALV